ncbi:hypothetical protein [Echinicola sp. 20G]|uniref:hypothetical protein n=1 Tax=Echinicola sp. 20G TaxID=2781961 RepID=UPI001910EBEE|nr:hypothetical protein [Echinicola sp. 20G]
MIAAIIFILVLLGLNLIPQIRKNKNEKLDRTLSKLTLASTVIFAIVTLFYFNDLRLKGLYSIPAVNSVFVLTVLIYFVFVTNSRIKIISIPILTIFILLGLITTFFGRKTYETEIDGVHKIIVTSGGLMACGQLIHITKTKFLIFDNEISYESSLCLRDIKQIDVVKFDNESAEFKIHHNGELDSENPYMYKIENKNVW